MSLVLFLLRTRANFFSITKRYQFIAGFVYVAVSIDGL